MKDFIPSNDAEFLIWLHNFRNKLAMYAPSFSIPAEDVGSIDLQISQMNTSVQEVAIQKEMMAKTVAQKNDVRKQLESEVRREILRFKAHKNYTEAFGQELGIISSKKSFDAATYKPDLKAEVTGGMVRIKFVKKGVDGVNIYRRKKGEAAWQFLTRDTSSPYEDRIKLENLLQPEHWEYRAYGVLKDIEIGQPSDVVEVIFGE